MSKKPTVPLHGDWRFVKWRKQTLKRYTICSETARIFDLKLGRLVGQRMCINQRGRADMKVSLSMPDGRLLYPYVSNLIAETFIGVRYAGSTVDHIDCDQLNNAVWNLRYLSHREQNESAVAGGNGVGESNGQAKLTDADIAEIFRLHAEGMTQRPIAARVGCSQMHVSRVLRGENRSKRQICPFALAVRNHGKEMYEMRLAQIRKLKAEATGRSRPITGTSGLWLWRDEITLADVIEPDDGDLLVPGLP